MNIQRGILLNSALNDRLTPVKPAESLYDESKSYFMYFLSRSRRTKQL